LFAALSGMMLRRLTQWRRGAGFDLIRADWLERATGLSGELRVRLPNGEFSGRGEGMDERGRLLVRLADGSLRTVTAGDVFPLGDGPAARASAKGRAG
jgi:BirA family transcriptional regulator, biotin operon repressor / biotin---[acetyl-CoA-carboxylase] ligase